MSLPGLFGTAIGQDAQGDGGGEGGDPSRLPVKDKDLTAPPGAPSVGDRYIVAAVATGAWTGHENDIAEWAGAAWTFETPVIGWIVYVDDETEYYSWNGTAWVQESAGPHASTHEDGGTDEINVAALSGELADPQPPKAHESTHHESGGDELDVEDLATDSVTPSDVVQGHTTFHQLSIGQPKCWKASVLSTLNTPPGGAIGVRHRIGAFPTGVWTGFAHALVEKNTMGSWTIRPNTVGDVHYHVADGLHYGWSGSAWLALPYDHAVNHKHGGGDEVSAATAGANLIPKANAAGKLDIGWMPDALVGALNFQGFWNASTNTPTLADGTGVKGQFYIATVAGTQDLGSGSKSYNIGDWALHDGSIWEKIDHTDAVASVFGRIGVVVATADDYTHAQLDAIGTDDHHNQVHDLGGTDHAAATLAELNAKVSDATLDDSGDPRDPNAHAASHQDGGSDEISVAGLSGALADAQTPSAHAVSHKDGGSDELDVEELASAGAADAIATSNGSGAVSMIPHDPVTWYDAARLDSPDGTSDVPGSMVAAPIANDSIASNIPVREFPDDVEKGVLLESTVRVPAGAVSMKIHVAMHAKIAPASAKQIRLLLYRRKHNSGSARGAWNSGYATIIAGFSTNTYDLIAIAAASLVSWGLSAGDDFQLLLSRTPLSAFDTLVGDLELRRIGLEFY